VDIRSSSNDSAVQQRVTDLHDKLITLLTTLGAILSVYPNVKTVPAELIVDISTVTIYPAASA
jgi:hypothetical protein